MATNRDRLGGTLAAQNITHTGLRGDPDAGPWVVDGVPAGQQASADAVVASFDARPAAHATWERDQRRLAAKGTLDDAGGGMLVRAVVIFLRQNWAAFPTMTAAQIRAGIKAVIDAGTVDT